VSDEPGRIDAFTADSLPERYERLLGPYLFRPWAEVLLDAVGLSPDAAVLDVASGTGILARAAARRVGPRGRVLATDISPAMVAFNAGHAPLPGSAPIETTVASATDLGVRDDEYDAVLCQQGMPFFPDRPGAVREMKRALRPGGVVGLAVWTPGHEVVPFGIMIGTLRDLGAAEPFPNAYDESSYVLTPEQVAGLLGDAGFHDIESREVEHVTHWPDVDAIYRAATGTPFAVLLDALDDAQRQQARTMMTERVAPYLLDGTLQIPTYSVIARAVV
jgi:ubiquinone/menaquinone biosynthesis C-methylase UbiE